MRVSPAIIVRRRADVCKKNEGSTQMDEVLTEVGLGDHAAELLEFAARGTNEVLHGDLFAVLRAEEGRRQHDIANVAAADAKLACKKPEIDVIREPRLGRHHAFPDAQS